MGNTVFCLMGPTASGKTDLALALVTQFPFEIISVDSAMIYRGMDIGTAKPSLSEQAKAPHHLIDILDPPESFSAAEFCIESTRLCDEIFQRGKIPLLVGGTMMYFNALQQGLSLLPDADDSLRQQLLAEANLHGWVNMHEKLAVVDPESAARIHPNDTQRIQRALEVYHATGKPLTALLAERNMPHSYDFVNFALMPEDRGWLHERIAQRFEKMVEQGFIDEVRHLLSTWSLPPTSPAMRCVGYRQAIGYIKGEYDYQQFCDKGIAATRQLAKRQMTWLRHWQQRYDILCDKPSTLSDIVAIIAKLLGKN